MKFEWDAEKARKNHLKHGISFQRASLVFADPLALTVPDPLHSEAEERFVTIGQIPANLLVVVAHTDRAGAVRIISARPATRHERRIYEEEP